MSSHLFYRQGDPFEQQLFKLLSIVSLQIYNQDESSFTRGSFGLVIIGTFKKKKECL